MTDASTPNFAATFFRRSAIKASNAWESPASIRWRPVFSLVGILLATSQVEALSSMAK
jgi:hypothetical protein